MYEDDLKLVGSWWKTPDGFSGEFTVVGLVEKTNRLVSESGSFTGPLHPRAMPAGKPEWAKQREQSYTSTIDFGQPQNFAVVQRNFEKIASEGDSIERTTYALGNAANRFVTVLSVGNKRYYGESNDSDLASAIEAFNEQDNHRA